MQCLLLGLRARCFCVPSCNCCPATIVALQRLIARLHDASSACGPVTRLFCFVCDARRHRHGHALQLYLAGPSCPHGCALQGHVRLAPGAARLDEQCAAEHRVAPTSVEQHMAVLGDRARRARAAAEQSDFCGEKNHLARRRAIAARAASCCAGCAPNEWQLRRRGADAHLPAAIEPS